MARAIPKANTTPRTPRALAACLPLLAAASITNAHTVGDPVELELVDAIAPFGDTGDATYTRLDAAPDALLALLTTEAHGIAVLDLVPLQHLATYEPAAGFSDVAITPSGATAFAATLAGDAVHVIDLANPSAPTSPTSITAADGAPTPITGVTLHANLLLTSSGSSPTVAVFDVANPAAPTLIRTVTTPETLGVAHAAISNDLLLITGRDGPTPADNAGAVFLYDASDLATQAPNLIATIDTLNEASSAATTPLHDLLFVTQQTLGGSVQLIDIQNPLLPVTLSTVNASDYGINAFSPIRATTRRKVAFVAWSQAGLESLDLDEIDAQNIIQPLGFRDTSTESPFNGLTGAVSIDPSIDNAFVLIADSRNGLVIVDASPIFPPVPCIGDMDEDDDVDVFDFNTFASNFGATDVHPFSRGDVDGDADVDVFDFNIFAANFGCPNN